MKIGIPLEANESERRVAITPESTKQLLKLGFEVHVQKGAGVKAGFSNSDFETAGARLSDESQIYNCDVIFIIGPPTDSQIAKMKKGLVLLSFLDPRSENSPIKKLAEAGVSAFALELIPRTSRAQSMDALSSQANIAGYRAVLEAATHYRRFFPMMMTSAGSTKPARVAVLGAGVAGLQAISTAKRLGATVEAYDVRAEVKEQIASVGAKFIEIETGEEGSGAGGYAKELSADAKARQQAALTEKLKKFDIIISTAAIPGRKAPVLITEDAVKGMRTGSVIVDLAAATGGNCPLTENGKVVEKHGVILVGLTTYPSLLAADSSHFYSRNLISLLKLIIEKSDSGLNLNWNFEDDIVDAALVTHEGKVRTK